MTHNGTVVNDFIVINSFPTDLEFTISDITSALGITNADVVLSSEFELFATIVTPTGTYTALPPDLDDNNVNQGGNTTTRLQAAGLRDAIQFKVTFFLPPAKTIRMTSFEELAVGPDNAVYVRNGAPDETLDLINGPDPMFVDYTAAGTSADDEIGFNTEYVAVPGMSGAGFY